MAQAQDPLLGANLSPNPLTGASLAFLSVLVAFSGLTTSTVLAFSNAALNSADIS
jgi:hypothetical protein